MSTDIDDDTRSYILHSTDDQVSDSPRQRTFGMYDQKIYGSVFKVGIDYEYEEDKRVVDHSRNSL